MMVLPPGVFLSGGVFITYCIAQARINPLHIAWDLDNTLLLSLYPMERGRALTSSIPASRYFDQIDDDFPWKANVPNTRTTWRPYVKPVLRFLGVFSTQYVFTAAQESYTNNIMEKLDPDCTIFKKVIHRDMKEGKKGVGKDLQRLMDDSQAVTLKNGSGDRSWLPRRGILFDDRVRNFIPQPENGVHVRSYDDLNAADWEMIRLCVIATLAFLSPDVRPVLALVRSKQHRDMFFRQDRA